MKNIPSDLLNRLARTQLTPAVLATPQLKVRSLMGLVIGFAGSMAWGVLSPSSALAATASEEEPAQAVSAQPHHIDPNCRARCESRSREARRRCYREEPDVRKCRRKTTEMLNDCLRDVCSPGVKPKPEPRGCFVDCEKGAADSYMECIAGGGGMSCSESVYWEWEFCKEIMCGEQIAPGAGPKVLGGKKPKPKKPTPEPEPAPEPEPEPEPEPDVPRRDQVTVRNCQQQCTVAVNAAAARCRRIGVPAAACNAATADQRSDCNLRCTRGEPAPDPAPQPNPEPQPTPEPEPEPAVKPAPEPEPEPEPEPRPTQRQCFQTCESQASNALNRCRRIGAPAAACEISSRSLRLDCQSRC